MRDLASRRIRVVEVATQQPSPFARSLLFGYVARVHVRGRHPARRAPGRRALPRPGPARRAARPGRAARAARPRACSPSSRPSCSGSPPDRRARDAEGVADLLRLLGPLTTAEVAARSVHDAADAAGWLAAAGRRPAGRRRCGSPARSAGPRSRTSARLRDGLGVPLPPGMPEAFTEPVERPAGRPGRPATPAPTARSPPPTSPSRLGLGVAVAQQTLARLAAPGRVLEGEFRPAGRGRRVVRRRGAAPAAPPLAGRAAQGGRAGRAGRRSAGSCRPGSTSRRGRGCAASTACSAVVEQLAGCAVPASALEPLVLPAGSPTTSPALLDELTATGEVLWAGHGTPARHRRLGVAAPRRHRAPDPARPRRARRDAAARRGARGARRRRRLLLPPARPTPSGSTDDKALEAALWDLVWAGPARATTPSPRCGR